MTHSDIAQKLTELDEKLSPQEKLMFIQELNEHIKGMNVNLIELHKALKEEREIDILRAKISSAQDGSH